jgi:ribonucleoside-diphosphate reductase alpha chain
MEENLRSELVGRMAHELTTIGQQTDAALTEERVVGILNACLKSLKAADAELLLSLASKAMDVFLTGIRPEVTEVRPQVLECDVVRFQNNREKWVALVGLLNGYPYEIFTGLADDEEGIVLPKNVTTGKIIKQVNPDGTKRYDFQFENKRGYKTTVEGLSEKFNPEYWNYAKLISGVLRYRMPIEHVIKLVASLSLKDESINTWKTGVERALKKYAPGGHDEEMPVED